MDENSYPPIKWIQRWYPTGAWDTTEPICNIPYTNDTTILGLRFAGTLERSIWLTWTTITTSVKVRAQEMYMSETKNKGGAHVSALQIMVCAPGVPATNQPRPTTNNGDHLVYMAWGHLSSTDIHTVPYGGRRWLRAADLHAKCATLYLLRLQQQQESSGTFTAVWLDRWSRFTQTANPLALHHMSLALSYLRPFFLEWAYIGKRLKDNTPRALKRRVYGALSEYNSKSTTPTPIRIHERHPHKDWRAIWRNVSMAHLQDTVTSIWCRATHHILPTN